MAEKKLSERVLLRLQTRKEAYDKWREFVDWTRARQSPRWVFRGHSQHWALLPTVGRDKARYQPEIEAQILGEFRRLAHPHLQQNSASMTDWDWIFVAQHHGLPTRLLDWTTNPLVAAYFASQPSPRSKKDGEIIAVEPRHSGFVRTNNDHEPLAIMTTKFVYPSAVASRITAQRGLFSVHPDPTKAWRLRNQTDRFVIPASVKADFSRFLHGLGIDAHLLMADLDGLASTIRWRFSRGIPFE